VSRRMAQKPSTNYMHPLNSCYSQCPTFSMCACGYKFICYVQGMQPCMWH
jgi:hypothetical protein